MEESKQILFTFDYELFLGQSGSVENCMILPTEKLFRFWKNTLLAFIFVDLTYLVRLNEIKGNIKAQKDWRLIEEQVNKISSLGHYIFYHVHPHWMDAVYVHDSNEWDLSNKADFT